MKVKIKVSINIIIRLINMKTINSSLKPNFKALVEHNYVNQKEFKLYCINYIKS